MAFLGSVKLDGFSLSRNSLLSYTARAMSIFETWNPTPESSWESLSGSCIWILLENAPTYLPAHQALHSLDWKLGGKVSRYLLESSPVPTFIATQGQIAIPLIAIDFSGLSSVAKFFENAKNMNFKKVIVLADKESNFESLKELVQRAQSSVEKWLFVTNHKEGP
jgi:hypothetical protein